MKKTFTALVIMSAIALSGCGATNQGPQQGVIVEKERESGEFDKKKKCTQYVAGKCKTYKESKKWDDADYKFLLKDGDREEWVDVNESDFNSFKEGDTYTVR